MELKVELTIGNDVAIEIWHDHDVELVRLADQLHRAIVDNDVIVLNLRVALGDLGAHLTEETVALLHNVRLVDARHLLAAPLSRILEGVLGNALRVGARADLVENVIPKNEHE